MVSVKVDRKRKIQRHYPAARDSDVKQGISVGWADVYDKGLDGQTIDITGVPTGKYWLSVTADPLNRLVESNENNNTTCIAIDLHVNDDLRSCVFNVVRRTHASHTTNSSASTICATITNSPSRQRQRSPSKSIN